MFAFVAGFSVAANAQLYDRGNGMIYDSDQDVTWLQDANYAKTSGWADNPVYSASVDGAMNGGWAEFWASNLVYGGYDDWRLPKINAFYLGCGVSGGGPFPYVQKNPYDCAYYPDTTHSELAYMWYVTLGNKPTCSVSDCPEWGWGKVARPANINTTADGVSFVNLQSDSYWMGQGPNSNYMYVLDVGDGYQVNTSTNSSHAFAWAVRDGDVTPSVPVPPSNVVPTANAGDDISVVVGDQVCLTGRGNDDNGDLLTFSWQFASTPLNSIALFDSANSATPCFTADETGVFVAELMVNDGLVNSSPSTVTITVGSSGSGSSACSALQSQLDDALFQIGLLNTEIVDLNALLATQATVVNNLTQERDSLQQEVNTLTSENAALSQQITDLTQQVNDLSLQVTDLQSQVSVLTIENVALTQQVNDLTLQVTDLQSQVSVLTSENAVLTQENSNLQAQVGVVTSQINLLDATFGGAIPGATPEEQLANLVAAIQNLNNGRLTGLLKDLGFKQ